MANHFDFHGSSVFTTLRSENKKLCLWPLHWQRLVTHANFFEYRLPEECEIITTLDKIMATTDSDQKIRVIIAANNFAILHEPYSPPPSRIYEGVTAILSTFNVHPQLALFKTGNSLPYSLAYKEAQKQNAFEAFLCNVDGYVVDGSRTSLMMFDGNTLTILDGGLQGCMRAHVLDYLKNFPIAVAKKMIKPSEIKGQLLLSNSLMGVIPVGPIEFPLVENLINRFRMD